MLTSDAGQCDTRPTAKTSPAMPVIADAADLIRTGRSQRSPMHRSTARARLLALAIALAAVSTTAPAVAAGAATVATPTARSVTSTSSSPPLSASDQAVHDNLTLRSTLTALGPDLAGVVTDAETGEILWSQTPLEHQLPASNAKLVTAVNALSTFGPGYRITTKVVQGAAPRRLVLVGGGDPSLSVAQLTALAETVTPGVRAQGLRTVRVLVDDSLFPAPSLAFGWKATYVHEDVRAVRALVVNQHDVSDTAINAGKVFAQRLEALGLKVTVVVRRKAPANAPVLATVRGQSLATMVGTMLRDSDNDYAEALHRLVALRTGFPATWAGAELAQRQALARLGVDLGTSTLYDGSGLSRADRLTPIDVVRVLSLAFDGAHPDLASLQHNSLAIAGVTGTLAPRFLRYVTSPTKCAAGLIEGKTGSLSGVIAFSGFARGADGKIKLFSFLLNRVPSTLTTRRAVDKLASTITGCW
jgi:D-alanyl-D-alanine carboxypeptidase/D-alanyl-D-alanine-endopeptidase (penicillin-binding protein 4)